MEIEAIRIPLRLAGGSFAHTGRYDGDIGGRAGRHSSVRKTDVSRALRKRQRRSWKKCVGDE